MMSYYWTPHVAFHVYNLQHALEHKASCGSCNPISVLGKTKIDLQRGTKHPYFQMLLNFDRQCSNKAFESGRKSSHDALPYSFSFYFLQEK